MTEPIPSARSAVDAAYREHERLLWGICYRMTGCAADADDLVHETYARAVERPPRRLDLPLRPWLVRVAVNLARDWLRRRRRLVYTGPWLPSPVEELADEPVESAEGRYERLESATFAFLLALEALTPQQRAVLLLRDVYEYSVRETAEALGLSEANVKTTLHRARKAMQGYDAAPCRPDGALVERHRDALARFVAALAAGDERALAELLAPGVTLLSDGGGEVIAALRPIHGAERVARFFLRAPAGHPPRHLDLRRLNGLPAVIWAYDEPPNARAAARYVIRCELGGDGRVREIHAVAAPAKLTGVRFPGADVG